MHRRFFPVTKTLLSAIVAMWCLFAAVNTLFAQGLTVFVPSTYAVGSQPYSVVAADVNGDGKLDLISANYGDNTLTVLTNNGNGVFGSNVTLHVGISSNPACVVAADINGDGKPDLVIADFGNPQTGPGGGLIVLTNNGSGVLSSNAVLRAGSNPIGVVVADVNGDGKPDLISVNLGSFTLTVLTNNGSGVFGSNATLNVGSHPTCVIAADVNGDGKPDLICANSYDWTLMVLTNNGNGVFGANATLNVGSYPSGVVAADVNGDGKPDLISANWGNNTLTVLTNNGSGIFGSNATLNVGSQPNCILAADLYGNGKMDLISANSGDNTLTVLTNNGNGVFGSNATLNVGSRPECVVAADINGDGKLDLISADRNDNTLTVLTQVIVGPPALSIASTNGNSLVLSWSSFSPGFMLLTNADLSTTNWVPAGYAISTSGTNQSTILTPPPGNLFFRLKQ